MTRRMFAGAIASGVSAWPQHSGTSEVAPPDLFTGPNFCSHEHWGSIDSIGRVPQGFRADVERGASPRRRTGLLDLLIEPYFEGWLSATGTKLDELVKPRAA